MDLGIRGRVAVVFGASSGLGKASAAQLVSEGAKVVVVSRDARRIEKTCAELGAALGVVGDLSRAGEGKRVIEEVTQKLGAPEILVLNTGGPPKGTFQEVSVALWEESFRGLWTTAVEAIQAALPAMRTQKWGRIVWITSVSAQEPIAGLTISNGLRAGISGLVNSLSREVARDGVTVNAALPGYTMTERLVDLGVSEASMAGQIPAERFGKPEEFGALVTFLASQPAAYLTGQAIACDGGWLRSV